MATTHTPMATTQLESNHSFKPTLNGVLLVNKQKGITSHQLVSQLRDLIGQKQVGHGGTLDPMAEGLMLILLGQGTKLSNYLLSCDKSYHFVFRLGVTTDTLDCTGKVLNQQPVTTSSHEIKKILEKNQGDLTLPVPLFSAVKVQGRKLYEYTRAQESITPPQKVMSFYHLVIKKIVKDLVEVELSCTKGSYIRSWVATVGDQLGTGACLEQLTRLTSHPFDLQSALTLDDIKERLSNKENQRPANIETSLSPAFIPFLQTLPHIKPIIVSKRERLDIQHGRISPQLLFRLKKEQKEVNQSKNEQVVKLMNHSEDQILALLQLNIFKPPKILRVFSSLR